MKTPLFSFEFHQAATLFLEFKQNFGKKIFKIAVSVFMDVSHPFGKVDVAYVECGAIEVGGIFG